MRILVDADSCTVKKQIENIAMKYGVRLLFYANNSIRLKVGFGRLFTVSKKPEAADEELLWQCGKNDIVVTQDFDLASKCMAKGAYVVHQNGWQYTEECLVQKNRNNKKKRRKVDNMNFEWTLELVLIKALEQMSS